MQFWSKTISWTLKEVRVLDLIDSIIETKDGGWPEETVGVG